MRESKLRRQSFDHTIGTRGKRTTRTQSSTRSNFLRIFGNETNVKFNVLRIAVQFAPRISNLLIRIPFLKSGVWLQAKETTEVVKSATAPVSRLFNSKNLDDTHDVGYASGFERRSWAGGRILKHLGESVVRISQRVRVTTIVSPCDLSVVSRSCVNFIKEFVTLVRRQSEVLIDGDGLCGVL
jgi:hypothetical protein